MFSIINRVSLYMRDFGIPFENIYISSSYFPDSFNKIVLEELNKVLPKCEYERNFSEYIFSLEGNGELKLIVYARNGKTRLIILPDDAVIDYSIPGKKIRESAIVERVKRKEEKVINEIISYLRDKKLSERATITLSPYEKELKNTANMCISYIDYCNKYYKETLKADSETEESAIKYVKPESSTIIRRTVIGDNHKAERVNSIISVADRLQILKSYDYIYSGYAYSQSNKEVEYLNYLYCIGDGLYALIMEPYNATSATKVQFIKGGSDHISREEFESFVKEALRIPYSELLKRKDIMRLYHSTLENYDNKLSIILKDASKKSNKSYLSRVRRIIEENVSNN